MSRTSRVSTSSEAAVTGRARRARPAGRRRGRARFAAVAALALGLLASGAASADPACIAAYEQTQSLRKDGKLVAARAQATVCARSDCPALLVKDCSRWLGELETSTPTVVLDARTAAGVERTDVRVKVDGVVLSERIDGKALAVDPGVRAFVFEPEGGERIERSVVVREGEKNKKVAVVLPATSAGNAARSADRPIPTGFWVFGIATVVALSTSAVFAVDGLARKNELDDCKPRCAPSDVDAMSTQFTVADVALGAGIMAGVAAAYLFFTRPRAGEAGAAARGPTPNPSRPGFVLQF